eukprot:1159738-Pelagomonas_calceolata.AAC.10
MEALARQEPHAVALDGDGCAVQLLCAQLVQLRHVARAQEHLSREVAAANKGQHTANRNCKAAARCSRPARSLCSCAMWPARRNT